ncbi:MAG: sodium-dependent transporter [Treponemataceae bacterium]|nr:sodium-dependent transporter [Treponemataceae bacterium]
MEKQKRGNFTGSVGFVLAAAGSAVGLGNIWRFPYLAAKNGGGLFLLCYVILVFTFGFALLTSEIAIGRKTQCGPLSAYKTLHPKAAWIGILACAVPVIILPYYCVIGGWILKFLVVFITGNGAAAAQDGFFTNFIGHIFSPIVFMALFLLSCSAVAFFGVDKGIEKSSRFLMPALFVLVIVMAFFSLTIKITGEDGQVRTGLQGLKIYLIPNFTGLTPKKLFTVIMDATSQLFYSISVAMGIMIAYGSYMRKEVDMPKAINRIEFFDTLVALLAGMMIIPAVYAFSDINGMKAGPGLIFISLPKIFMQMKSIGPVVAILFFLLVAFAAQTSAVSVMEAIISSLCDRFRFKRKLACIVVTVYAFVFGVIVCLGYNMFYFELTLPNGTKGQILDLFDYMSNTVLMPIVAIATCVLIGWVLKCSTITDEVKIGAEKFGREHLYIVMTKYIVPLILIVLFVQAFIQF